MEFGGGFDGAVEAGGGGGRGGRRERGGYRVDGSGAGKGREGGVSKMHMGKWRGGLKRWCCDMFVFWPSLPKHEGRYDTIRSLHTVAINPVLKHPETSTLHRQAFVDTVFPD